MDNLHFLCRITDIRPKHPKRFVLPDGQHIVLFQTDSGYHAIVNRCPHAGARLDDGFLQKDVLTCIWHGWQFNLKTRRCLSEKGAKLKGFTTVVQSDEIFIELAPSNK